IDHGIRPEISQLRQRAKRPPVSALSAPPLATRRHAADGSGSGQPTQGPLSGAGLLDVVSGLRVSTAGDFPLTRTGRDDLASRLADSAQHGHALRAHPAARPDNASATPPGNAGFFCAIWHWARSTRVISYRSQGHAGFAAVS